MSGRITRLNSKGPKGSPCWTPVVDFNLVETELKRMN
jgi:hypothetical protein